MYLQDNTYLDIAIKLNEEGIPSPSGKAKWSNATIGSILKNPIYYGESIVNKYVFKDGKRGAGTLRTKQSKDAEEHIRFEVEPLIDKEKWDSLQRKIKFNKGKNKRVKREDALTDIFWLRDVLVCGNCGSKIMKRKEHVRKDGTRRRYYVCYNSVAYSQALKIRGK